MINKNILRERVITKFQNIALNSIVFECYINGLPIKSEHIDETETSKLRKYIDKVMESLGGFDLVIRAVESNLEPAKKDLMIDILGVCNESAIEVANRICKETDTRTSDNLEDVVASAEFTEEEYAKFINNADTISKDEISGIINEKTKNVLISERDTYEKEEELENELKENIASDKTLANESVSSYLDIILEKDSPRHHISLFSKMQAHAYESVDRISDESEYNYFQALDKFTFESFLPELKVNREFVKVLESVIELQNSSNNKLDVDSKIKISTLVTTLAYTVMETLNTLNLYTPSKDNIKEYVTSPYVTLEGAIKQDVAELVEKSKDVVDELEHTDLSEKSENDLNTITDRLTRIKELLEIITINNADFLNSRTEILNSLTNTLSRINKFIKDNGAEDIIESDSYYAKQKRDNDIAQLDKVNTLFAKKPDIAEVRLNVDPESLKTFINVTAVDSTGQTKGNCYIYLSQEIVKDKLIGYLTEIFEVSKLKEFPKDVVIYLADGSAKKIKLK